MRLNLDRREAVKLVLLLNAALSNPEISPEYKTIRDKIKAAVEKHDQKMIRMKNY